MFERNYVKAPKGQHEKMLGTHQFGRAYVMDIRNIYGRSK